MKRFLIIIYSITLLYSATYFFEQIIYAEEKSPTNNQEEINIDALLNENENTLESETPEKNEHFCFTIEPNIIYARYKIKLSDYFQVSDSDYSKASVELTNTLQISSLKLDFDYQKTFLKKHKLILNGYMLNMSLYNDYILYVRFYDKKYGRGYLNDSNPQALGIVNVKDAYYQNSFLGLDYKVGHINQCWGNSVLSSPVNIINPQDYASVFTISLERERKHNGLPGVLLEKSFQNTKFTLTYYPNYVFTSYNKILHETLFNRSIFSDEISTEVENKLEYENKSFSTKGLEFKHSFTNFDLGLYYFQGPNYNPLIERFDRTDYHIYNVRYTFRQREMTGFSLQIPVKEAVFQFEAAYFPYEYFDVADDKYIQQYNTSLKIKPIQKYLFGIEKELYSDSKLYFMLNAQSPDDYQDYLEIGPSVVLETATFDFLDNKNKSYIFYTDNVLYANLLPGVTGKDYGLMHTFYNDDTAQSNIFWAKTRFDNNNENTTIPDGEIFFLSMNYIF